MLNTPSKPRGVQTFTPVQSAKLDHRGHDCTKHILQAPQAGAVSGGSHERQLLACRHPRAVMWRIIHTAGLPTRTHDIFKLLEQHTRLCTDRQRAVVDASACVCRCASVDEASALSAAPWASKLRKYWQRCHA